MINGNLKFFPILMDECKNNPEKVQKKIKYLKYANYIYFFASIIGFTLDSILNAHSKIDFTLTNLVLGVVIFFFAMLPLLVSISWIHELSEGVRYFKEKRSDKEFILGQMRELLKKRKKENTKFKILLFISGALFLFCIIFPSSINIIEMEEHSPRIENMFLMVCGVVLFLYSWKKMDTAREDFENKFLEEPREK